MAFQEQRRRFSSLSPADSRASFISPSTESLVAPSETPAAYVSASESPSSVDDDSFMSMSHSSSLADTTDEFAYFSHLDDLPPIPAPTSSSPSPPPSPPASLSSSESATFQLGSPSPRPQITRPLLSHAWNRRNFSLGNKENSLGRAAESIASTSTSHIRIQSKPSNVGFPFASSILSTSNSLADVRGGSRVPRPSGKGKGVLRASWEEEDSRRSSSDVDLDLSFDIPNSASTLDGLGSHEHLSGGEAASKVRGHLQRPEWVEIPISASSTSLASSGSTTTIDVDRTPMMGSSKAHNVPASELVRSHSGQLLGTRKRIRSAIELREAYLAGETPAIPESSSFAIIMDAEVESGAWEGAEAARAKEALTPGRARAAWVRKTSMNPGLRLGSAMPKVILPSKPYSPTLGAGFAFNPTDPLNVPLPASPASPDTLEDGHRRQAKGSPLQLDEGSQTFPAPSPAWSFTSYFQSVTGRKSSSNVGGSDSTGARQSSGDDPRPSWSSDARTTLSSLRWRRGEPTTPSDTSPTFTSQFDHRADSISTTPTPPNDSPIVPDYPPFALLHQPRRQLSKPALLIGLGFESDITKTPPAIPRRVVRKKSRHVPNIPSLSISPPPPADDADVSDSGESALDPQRSPSYRLSARFSRVGLPRVDGDSDDDLADPSSAPHRRTLLEGSWRVSAMTIPGPRATLAPARFSFTPAPLTLVREQLNRVARYEVVPIATQPTRPRMSIASFTDVARSYPGSLVDEMVPAKLYFVLGFLFGPWCWIVGGWWLRSEDGEHLRTHGVRCREAGCSCGRFVQWHSVAGMRRHGGALPVAHQWWGVDKWVVMNRTASVASSLVVAGCFVAAVWAASV